MFRRVTNPCLTTFIVKLVPALQLSCCYVYNNRYPAAAVMSTYPVDDHLCVSSNILPPLLVACAIADDAQPSKQIWATSRTAKSSSVLLLQQSKTDFLSLKMQLNHYLPFKTHVCPMRPLRAACRRPRLSRFARTSCDASRCRHPAIVTTLLCRRH